MKYPTAPSYDIIHAVCEELILKCKSKDATIVGLSRGGLIPGVIMSHMIERPFVPVVYSSAKGKGETQVRSMIPHLTGSLIIVDDICDTGHTMDEIANIYADQGCSIQTVSLYWKEGVKHSPNIYQWKIPHDSEWIIFPWEP